MSTPSPRLAILGGGAAGFFLALNVKEMMSEIDVTIFERSQRVLAKVEISGGGRCNCTNTFEEITDLQLAYPRGHRLMKRLMKDFGQREACRWFEDHGVKLVVQEDQCVFPAAQDSHVIIECFLRLARDYHIRIERGRKIMSLSELEDYDFVAVTTGGSPKASGLTWLADMGHEIVSPVPSLFTLNIPEPKLTELMGLVIPDVSVQLTGTKAKANGPLLITHWGVSGPAVLKLSSYGARLLAEQNYRMSVSVNWTGANEADVISVLTDAAQREPQKQLTTYSPLGLPQRLWAYLLERALGERAAIRWCELNKKDRNRLTNTLTNDTYKTDGRATFKEEFVTCGGVSLNSINPSTMESRCVEGLYFAGEVLDIDAITGGFNFQAAWTTAYTAAKAIVSKAQADK
ncbi:MAG: aminoacetone oxidase family FAD-binding enzyme [Bacteroidaceae bacterium]|nr:aminoacetone oxidase family FAD-binding enzyme [Bacteroidaceae bacterium]